MKKLFILIILAVILTSCKNYKASLSDIVTPYTMQYGTPTKIKTTYSSFNEVRYNYIFSEQRDHYADIDIVKGWFGWYLKYEYISIDNTSTFKTMNSIFPYSSISTTTIKE